MFHFEEFGFSSVGEGKLQWSLGLQATQLSRISSSSMPGQAIIAYKVSLPNYTLILSKWITLSKNWYKKRCVFVFVLSLLF